MKELKGPAPARQDLLMDYLAYYGTKWLEGKLVACNETTIKTKARHFLEGGESFSRFNFYGIAENCFKMKKEQGGNTLRNLIKAFEFLELLCVNLFLFPWRKEIKSLKTFTGNFVYCIQSVLPEDVVKTLLEKIGYIATTATEFSLAGKINEEETKQTAFEIFLARLECEMILEMTNEEKHSDLGDILQKRAQMHWCQEDNEDRASQSPESENSENQRKKENSETPSCLATQEKSSTNKEISFESAGNSKIKEEFNWLASPPSTHTLQGCQRQGKGSVRSHREHSDSEDFLKKYSDIVIRHKPIFNENLPLTAFEKPRDSQSEERVLAIAAQSTTGKVSPTPLSPGASGPRAFAIFHDTDIYKVQEIPEEAIEAEIKDAMGCMHPDPADQPKELKSLVYSNSLGTEHSLSREEIAACEVPSSFSKQKIKEAREEGLMYPMEETAQPESITYTSKNDKDIRECSSTKMKCTYATNAQTAQVDPSSSRQLCHTPAATEYPIICSENKRLLMDAPGTHSAPEGIRHIREPPHLTYIPPQSIDAQLPGGSNPTAHGRRNLLAPEGGSLESFSCDTVVNCENCTAKINETNPEDYVIINNDDQ
ncbi:uncharacterized protein LOC102565681 [Alligator mississippiensis]|uniref:uncharacterized protein LOC102565681 n=1 Tax=Alligator mississippiensis TaxID=8496 RepID=UPI002877B730|nr:uncharacterized protein LOC102565681 [Alligator mississippiensis]